MQQQVSEAPQGAVWKKKNASSVTHNFVYSFVNGAMEKPPVSDPWACLRNTKIPACWFMFPTIYLQEVLWSMIEAIALESGMQLDGKGNDDVFPFK